MENYTKNKLQKAANSIGGVHPDWGPLTSFQWGFKEGAKWLSENMWISVEEELPDADKPCFVITKNNKCSVSNMYIPKDCHGNTLGGKEWKGSLSFKESIVAWMPIPEFKKGE
jgi:hypothetical protein